MKILNLSSKAFAAGEIADCENKALALDDAQVARMLHSLIIAEPFTARETSLRSTRAQIYPLIQAGDMHRCLTTNRSAHQSKQYRASA